MSSESRAGHSVVADFSGAELGDRRRSRRLDQVVRAIEARPDAGFPCAMVTEAALEGLYRFLRNDKVSFESLLQPHVAATVARASERDCVLAVHDTTSFSFGGEVPRTGLGRLNRSAQGFLSHVTLTVSADGLREALGVVGVRNSVRDTESVTAQRKKGTLTYAETRTLETEQARWGLQVDAVEATVGEATSLIHVMDSEADDYALLAKLVGDDRRFVVRLCYDRVLDVERSGSGACRKIKEFIAQGEVTCTRIVPLSRRGRQPGGGRKRGARREGREALLGFRSTEVVLRAPRYRGDEGSRFLALNVVYVREVDPPDGVEPVEWILATTEPVDTEDRLLRVVDWYRSRWTIEEYFKAIKTGCAYEKRQLGSRKTLFNALALFIPIAWNLLRLRQIARLEPDAPASKVLNDTQIEVLQRASETPLPAEPTARDVLMAIARLGGHLKRNGEPGWQVLGRGYADLLRLEYGYRLALR